MQRENRLAVFEHVPPKKQANTSKNNCNSLKRARSPELPFEDNLKIRKRRRKGIYDVDEQLMVNCQYEDCNYSTNKYYDLLKHLAQHVDEIQENLELDYSCKWENCEYIAENSNYLKMHLTYHGYHTKLKIIGDNVLNKLKLPDCKELNEFKFPSLPEYYQCEWENCNSLLWNYQMFVDHVKCHVNAQPKKSEGNEDAIYCGWIGCTNTYPLQHKLLEHIRSHTKEKMIACPSCGVMFSCKTKFYDHRKRQLSIELQGYQCSQCSKLFASERLLRDHMRIHINHYKCNLCDMTCTKPSNLAKHIRYRHLPERLFKCDICNHSTISLQDLINHKETHNNEKKMECLLCGFKCRTKFTIEKHIKKHEGTWTLKYACHCCDKRFERGALLTQHLIKVHDFHWPSGHSRFSYKQNPKTGLYHLQVVRYESLEVTQEMMEGNIPYQFGNNQDCTFECIQNKPLSFVLKVSNGNNSNNLTMTSSNKESKSDSVCEKEKLINNDKVIITVEEVDARGNVIKVETIESGKILFASEISKQQYKLIK